MKTFKIEISETELDLIRQALSFLEVEAKKDSTGIVKRKMPKEENRKKYLNAIAAVRDRFIKIQ
jgi:hypothetical protein